MKSVFGLLKWTKGLLGSEASKWVLMEENL